MKTGIAVGLGIAIGSAAVLVPSWAQNNPAAKTVAGAPSTQEVRRRLRLLRAWEITRALKLDGEAAGKVLAVFARTDDRRSAIFSTLRQSRQEMTKMLRKKSGDATRMQSLVDSYMQARMSLAQLNNEEFQELRGVLSPDQQAKYLLAKRRFSKKVQQMLRQVRK